MILEKIYKAVGGQEIQLDALPVFKSKFFEKLLKTDDDRILQCLSTDSDGNCIVKDQFTYNSAGLLVGLEEYFDSSDIPGKVTATTWSEEGRKISEKYFSMGDPDGEMIFAYTPEGFIQSEKKNESDGTTRETRYSYSKEFQGKEILVEFFENGKLLRSIESEWELINNIPELTRQDEHNYLDPRLSRIYRYFKPEEMENGVAMEIFNGNGDYLEECREVWENGNMVRQCWHTDEQEESVPYKFNRWEYDVRGRLILNEMNFTPRQKYCVKIKYDNQDRIQKKLLITTSPGSYEVEMQQFEYSEVPDDFRLF